MTSLIIISIVVFILLEASLISILVWLLAALVIIWSVLQHNVCCVKACQMIIVIVAKSITSDQHNGVKQVVRSPINQSIEASGC